MHVTAALQAENSRTWVAARLLAVEKGHDIAKGKQTSVLKASSVVALTCIPASGEAPALFRLDADDAETWLAVYDSGPCLLPRALLGDALDPRPVLSSVACCN